VKAHICWHSKDKIGDYHDIGRYPLINQSLLVEQWLDSDAASKLLQRTGRAK
jgi:hypothetical protein